MFQRDGRIESVRSSEQSPPNSMFIQEDGRRGDRTANGPMIPPETPCSSVNSPSGRYLAFVRYTSIGGFATAVHYLVLIMLVEWLDLAPSLAATSGAACGALIAYVGNHRFTFGSRSRHHIALPRFLFVAALGAVLNGVIVWLGTEALSWHYLIAQVVATFVVLLMSYHFNRTWSFS